MQHPHVQSCAVYIEVMAGRYAGSVEASAKQCYLFTFVCFGRHVWRAYFTESTEIHGLPVH